MITLLLKLFVKDYRNTSNLIVRKRYGLFASFFGLFTNLILFVGKIFIGVFLGLYSIVTDAMNNLSDFGNNFISIVGVKVSA
jgi:divalent metal cation (Fe/Co/Zn/Cd) transporter